MRQRPSTPVDAELIAATNTDLEEMVADGRFREELISVECHSTARAALCAKDALRFPPSSILRQPCISEVWPARHSNRSASCRSADGRGLAGNVRQLCNEVQRFVARSEDGTLITAEQLSPELRRMRTVATPAGAAAFGQNSSVTVPANATLNEALAEVERKMIRESLQKHRGNISRAARELGLTRRGLYLKLDRYQIKASA